jgi:phosphatidylglycerol:prolipoprotein diacylglycerol transferase
MKNKILKYTLVILAGIIFYTLYLVFKGALTAPQMIHLGPLPIRYFGIVLALAVLAAYKLALKRASLYQIVRAKAEDTIFWVIVGGFIGARVYHVLSSLPYYLQNPDHIIMVWHGGLSIIGSLLGGLITLYFLSNRNNKTFLSYLDWLAPAVVLGQIIGRFADLFNYELFGYPTNLPWQRVNFMDPVKKSPAGKSG